MNAAAAHPNHFQISNKWEPDYRGPKYLDGTPQYVIDTSTGDKYWNESNLIIATKLLLGVLATPVYHLSISVIQAVCQIFKIMTFYPFWNFKENQGAYSSQNGLKGLQVEVLNLITGPFVLVALEASAVFGLFNPNDGRKLYAKFEKILLNDNYLLFPCFQPNPKKHLLGGDPLERDAF